MGLLLKNIKLERCYKEQNNGLVVTETETKDLLIKEGCFAEIADEIAENTPGVQRVIDGRGQLLVPSLRESHIHIDKTYFSGPWQAPTRPEDFSIYTRLNEEKELLPAQLDVAAERAHKVVQHYIQNGHTHIRTHCNIDPQIGLKHVELTLDVLKQYEDQIMYEIVAFPQHGLLRNGEKFIQLFEQALNMGVTHIGGLDFATLERDVESSLQLLVKWAKQYDLGIDIHLHDRGTLGVYEIERLLDMMAMYDYQGEVTLSHAFALAQVPAQKKETLFRRLAERNVDISTTVVISPGLTLPIFELDQYGVKVSVGHDSLTDHWSPFGTGDTIQKLNLLSEQFNLIDEKRLSYALKFGTGGVTPLDSAGRQVWPKVGMPANALLVDAVSSAHLIARRCPISTVISRGQVISEQSIQQKGAYRG